MNTYVKPEPLFNRHHLLEQLSRQVAESTRSGRQFALLAFNLNKFREVNAGFGHHVGDVVLEQVQERVRTVLRPDDMLFHIGNDEFAVILADIRTQQIVHLATSKILENITRNYEVAGTDIAITAVAGAVMFPDHANNRDELLRSADHALNYAREHHQDYAVFDTDVRKSEQQLASVKGYLRKAIENDELMLYYQPQVDLLQGSASGCEALMRWKHPGLGWVRPDTFIPVAEKSDLIESLTYWSINVGLREWSKYCDSCSSASIAINLSAKILNSREVVDLVSRAMNIWGAEPGRLLLEVTESAMMRDPKAALHTLSALHEMGITLSIDDFGTGYSSLAYLKKLPVAELKIDKSFVMNMAENSQDCKIVQSIIDLAHNLEMRVVAEGIENEQILDMLIKMGCDYGQGFYIARPMPIGDLLPWVEASVWNKPGVVCEQSEYV